MPVNDDSVTRNDEVQCDEVSTTVWRSIDDSVMKWRTGTSVQYCSIIAVL